jgi:uncharacterized protein (DUF1697 family)
VRYVALIRGINVGGRAKLPMADLRSALAGLGHTAVKTHLNSGNAVFTSAQRNPEKIAADLARALDTELGLRVAVLVRTADELRSAVEANPLPVPDGSRFFAVFLTGEPDLSAFTPGQFEPEVFAPGDGVMYYWCPGGLRDSPMLKAMTDKKLQVTGTARNWNTVTRIAELL